MAVNSYTRNFYVLSSSAVVQRFSILDIRVNHASMLNWYYRQSFFTENIAEYHHPLLLIRNLKLDIV